MFLVLCCRHFLHPSITLVFHLFPHSLLLWVSSRDLFRHASSHHLLYLQLRRDVLEERVIVDADFLFKLAGLALQAEYGDYSKDKAASTEDQQGGAPPAPYFNAEHYIPGRVLKQTGPSNACTKVTRRHKATAGLSCAEAELEFVKVSTFTAFIKKSEKAYLDQSVN